MTREEMKMRAFGLLVSHEIRDEGFEADIKALIDLSFDYFEALILNLELANTDLHIECIKKEQKSLVVQVPNEYSNINQNAFNEWIAYKKYKNKGAITKTLNMLNKYDFQTQQKMVDKSIMNEYKGLFEPKQSQPYNTPKSQILNTNINVWDAIERKGITNG